MTAIRGRVSPSGRLSLPAAFRKAAGLEHGGNVVIELHDREIRIRTIDDVIARSLAITRRLLGDKRETSVEAFLAERRRETERE
jgi:bifunctional DNA-binding transcriptional regulator/antitoxin component of YhaV-PrlF toxin-antitoxin module